MNKHADRFALIPAVFLMAALAGAPAMAQPSEPAPGTSGKDASEAKEAKDAKDSAEVKDAKDARDRAGRIRVSDPPSASPLELSAIQGMLAVQQLDGWLLCDNAGENPIAMELVAPSGEAKRKWFYFVRAEGQPIALVHEVDAPLFVQVPGETTTYTNQDELKAGLGRLLKGAKRVAMEHEPKAAVPELSRVDSATIALVRKTRVTIVSSAELVQLTKAQWGPSGRLSHYVAVHHLTKLREQAVAMITQKLKANEPVTELDVQNFLERGYRMRGLVGAKPVVAVGANSANPQYRTTGSRQIRLGDIIVLRLAGRVGGEERSIFASTTWIVYAGQAVPPQLSSMFAALASARDAAIATMADRVRRRRAIKGFEIDRRVRSMLSDAGFTKNILHRTGHALDSELYGAGANLDDGKNRDSRNLVAGSGFSVSPGLYIPGQLGIRAEANVYIGANGIEVTTPLQPRIIPLLASQQPEARSAPADAPELPGLPGLPGLPRLQDPQDLAGTRTRVATSGALVP